MQVTFVEFMVSRVGNAHNDDCVEIMHYQKGVQSVLVLFVDPIGWFHSVVLFVATNLDILEKYYGTWC